MPAGIYTVRVGSIELIPVIIVEGIVKEETATGTEEELNAPAADATDATKKKAKKTVKVLRKIPPKVIQEARGIVIFTAMRSGFAPFGGAGGSGVVLARLEDGCESRLDLVCRGKVTDEILARSVVCPCFDLAKQPLHRSAGRYRRLRLCARAPRSQSRRGFLYPQIHPRRRDWDCCWALWLGRECREW